MTITYRSSGAWGAGKGSNLTAAEVDGNFYDIDTRLESVENNPAEPAEISSITSSGSALTVTLSDGTVYGPLTIPVASINFEGEWTPSTVYAKNDLITYQNKVYYISAAHTSDSTFSASRTISGVLVYQLMIDTEEASVDAVGAALAAGAHTNISFSYNDTSGAISATVDTAALTEAAVDGVGAALAAGTHSGISFSYNDAGNSISATVSQIAFTALSDVPASYTSQSGKLVRVKSDASGLEFVNANALVPTASVPRFMGAQVYLSGSTSAQNYSSGTSIAFASEAYDTDAFHDNVTNNTRLTIPAGLGIKKVKVSATVRVSSIAAGSDNILSIRKGGLDTYIGSPGLNHENSAATATTISIASGAIPVSDGEYFEVFFQTSDTSTGLEADRTSFTIEVVEVEGGINIANVQTDSTTARTLSMADINAHLLFTNGSAVTVTVPLNATVAFPIGSTIDLEQNGDGKVSVVGDGGVTVNRSAAYSNATANKYSVLKLRKVATNTWTLFGDLEWSSSA